jgi:hypothetical protein
LKFLFVFSLSVAVIAILHGTTMTLLDPRATFGTGIFPSLVLESRKAKMVLFEEYLEKGPVEGLLLGSSRAFKFKPVDLQAALGQRFFNFAVGGANTEDYLAIYRWVRRQGVRPKTVLIGHDPTTLHDADQHHKGFAQNEVLNLALEGNLGILSKLTLYKETFSTAYVTDAARSVLLWLQPSRRREPQWTFEADGYTREPQIERARAAGAFDLERAIDGCIDVTVESFDMTTLSEWRKEFLEKLVAEARADGAKVMVILTPNYHPRVERALLARKPYAEMLDQVRRHLEELKAIHGITILDFTDLASFGGTDTDWNDCTHLSEANAARLVSKLSGKDP